MEKVEQVLAVEEEARLVITNARERAVAIRAAAELEVRRVLSETSATAATAAVADRERTLAKAAKAADALAAEAAAEREVALASARTRMPAVSRQLADSLKG